MDEHVPGFQKRQVAEWLCQLAATKCLPRMVHCANSCSTFGYLARWIFLQAHFTTLGAAVMPSIVLAAFSRPKVKPGSEMLRRIEKWQKCTVSLWLALLFEQILQPWLGDVGNSWKFLEIRQSHGPFRRVPCPHSASLSSWQTSPFRIPNLKCTMGWEHTSHRPQRKDEQSRAKFQNFLKQCEEMLMLKFRLPWKIIACSSH